MTDDQARQLLMGDIRLFLRDAPDLNKLIDGHEHQEEHITGAISMALADFNAVVPLSAHTLTSIPAQMQALFVRLTVVTLWESLGALLERNELEVRDIGGVAARGKQLDLLARRLPQERARVENRIMQAKISWNLAAAMGGCSGVPSVYSEAGE